MFIYPAAMRPAAGGNPVNSGKKKAISVEWKAGFL
jgi:hypothetical protein